jgi:peptidoglycan/LPS O-acetylase OafA/YrhL
LNTRLIAIILFCIFVVYAFILSVAFPPNYNTLAPTTFTLFFTIGLIIFMWSNYALAMIEYKSRILPLTKLSLTWIVSSTITCASFSILYFSEYVTRQLGFGFYSLILLLIGCLALFISGRKLDNKNRQKVVASLEYSNQNKNN